MLLNGLVWTCCRLVGWCHWSEQMPPLTPICQDSSCTHWQDGLPVLPPGRLSLVRVASSTQTRFLPRGFFGLQSQGTVGCSLCDAPWDFFVGGAGQQSDQVPTHSPSARAAVIPNCRALSFSCQEYDSAAQTGLTVVCGHLP